MIELLIIDLAALLLAPELKARLLLSQADKDGLHLTCFADLPRQHVKYALRRTGYLQAFDSLIYSELFSVLTTAELRQLASPNTLWLRTPTEIDYAKVLSQLPARQRLLPRILRFPASLDSDAILDTDES